MKFKKIAALLAAFMLAVALIPAAVIADDNTYPMTEFYENGGFERKNEEGNPVGWAFSGGAFGKEFALSDVLANSGNYSLRLVSSQNTLSFGRDPGIFNMVPDTELTLNFFFKVIRQTGKGFSVKVEFYSEESGTTASYITSGEVEKFFTDAKIGRWVNEKMTFSVPHNARRMNVNFMFTGGGEVFVDDISLTGPGSDEEVEAENKGEKVLPPFEGESNRVKNGSFEEANEEGTGPADWGVYLNEWKGNGFVSRDTKEAKTGSASLKISTNKGGNPWAACSIDIVPGEEYQISAWIKSSDMSGTGFAFKVEGYDAQGKNTYGKDVNKMLNVSGQWKQYVQRFRVEEESCVMVKLLPRLYGNGTVYVDDVVCYKTDGLMRIGELICDEVFHYSDWTGNGKAYVDAYLNIDPGLAGGKAEFSLKDGKNVLLSGSGSFDDGRAEFEYPLSLLKEKNKAYTVSATVIDENGNELKSFSKNVYRYDRPTRLTEDGVYLRDGKPFNPVIGYHVPVEMYPKCAEAGINVVQLSYWYFDYEADPKRLDMVLSELEKYDLMGIVCLYRYMRAAGDESNINNTRKVVTALKNHPNVFAYAMMDEPIQQIKNNVEEILHDGYKVIRDIDPDIPVYLVDCIYDLEGTEKYERYCDIVAVDPYPSSLPGEELTDPRPISTYQATHVKKALNASDYKKPVYAILQTFDWRGHFPTSDIIRLMVYQSFLQGVKGFGYFCLKDAQGFEGSSPVDLPDTDRWPGLVSMAKNEFEFMFDHFVYDKYPLFNEKRGEDAWYRSWVMNGKIYMIIIGLDDNKEPQLEIPMVSTSGKVKVKDFTAKLLYGGEEQIIESNDGILRHKLGKLQGPLFEITPKEPIDFSPLYKCKYIDLYEHDWAREAIETIREKGIANSSSPVSFAPAKNITRADFAMFLIRTLGLTSNDTESFADIPENAYYAKEIAVGKALGLVKGTGDNTFDPEGEISRQDLMAICYRGMSYAGKLGNATKKLDFADANLASDYALEAISAMVESGIIKGNNEGLINPLGNATRAEAAVIMYRILSLGI